MTLVNKPPAYQHYARDWLVDTASLSLEEQGAYLRLLDQEWIEGPLANNPLELARRLGVSRPKFARLWAVIVRFFELGEDGKLRNPRLESERAGQQERREKASQSGKIGAEKRWHSDDHRHGEGHSARHSAPTAGRVALQSASASATAERQLHGGASRRAPTKASIEGGASCSLP